MHTLSGRSRAWLALETLLVGCVFALLLTLALSGWQAHGHGNAVYVVAALLLASVAAKVMFVLLLRVTVIGRLPAAGAWRVPPLVVAGATCALVLLAALGTVTRHVENTGPVGSWLAMAVAALCLTTGHLAWCYARHPAHGR